MLKKTKDLNVIHAVVRGFEKSSVGEKFCKRVTRLLMNLDYENDLDAEIGIEENVSLTDDQIDAIENDEMRD